MPTGRKAAIRAGTVGTLDPYRLDGKGQQRPERTGDDGKGVNGIRVTECDKALMTISRVATLLNCVSASIIEGELPKGTTTDEIGSALSLLSKELKQALEKIYNEAL